MNAWKKVAVVNIGGLLGIGVSLFIVPPHTPLWIWAAASALCLIVLNHFFIRRLQRGAGKRNANSTSSVVIYLSFIVLLLELVFRYWHH